jgi:ABC-type ATPase with predicted acetyltransferase domain
VIDEFMAVLDRTAAKVIAYSIQKIARRMRATLLVATTHTDMKNDLHPDLYIEKRYREKLRMDVIDRARDLAGTSVLTQDDINTMLLKTM